MSATLSPYPRATIRLQLSGELGFAEAASLVPDFARMGFSHLYASPILTARAGSAHGYDIVDHNTINPELGGERGFRRLVERLHKHSMGLILDFVPNHMGVGYHDNRWWLNVLEWGQRSPYAGFFDIDWNPSEQSLRGKVLIPVLGQPYGDVLESAQLKLALDHSEGSFSVHYYEHRFPVSPHGYSLILDEAIGLHPDPELSRLRDSFSGLRSGRSAADQAMTIQQAEDLRARLATMVRSDREVARAVETACRSLNGRSGEPASFDRLHRLLERQAYRLAYWRLASNEINYRRFFDINNLAAIRMELPDVFTATHELIMRLIGEGAVQGLRLDHVDGLLDPRAYLERLQEAAAYRIIERRGPAFEPREAQLDQPLYVVVEKILAHHEQLRSDWAASGTTGYDHMALVGELQTDPDGELPLTRAYEHFIAAERDFEALVRGARYRTMQETLASELNVLANRLSRLAKRHRRTRDLSRLALRSALMDVVAHFPVYRTYVDNAGVSDADRRDIEWAVGRARKASRGVDTTAHDFVEAVLTTDLLQDYPGAFRRRDVVELAMKIQQFTSPVMAKSVEDTAFYRDMRLLARNEVGSEPERFYCSPQAFHYACSQRQELHPFAMITTATHDHKRGEDVRARLAVLSELSGYWSEWSARMADYCEVFTTPRDEGPAPSRRDQYLTLQTIVGCWPLDCRPPHYRGMEEFRQRMTDYLLKAVREAKLETSWTQPDTGYEDALTGFVESLLSPQRSGTMPRLLHEVVSRIEVAGALNGLVQKALTLTVPGVPDVYQGTDGWDFSLVDPDNRRRPDFQLRNEWLERADQERAEQKPPSGTVGSSVAPWTRQACTRLLREWRSGEIKHRIVRSILSLRMADPDLFARGDYRALECSGRHAHRVLAFARMHAGRLLLVAVALRSAALLAEAGQPLPPPEHWEDTAVLVPPGLVPEHSLLDPAAPLVDPATDAGGDGQRRLLLADLFASVPLAVLTGGIDES